MTRTRLALLAAVLWPAVGMTADVKATPPAAADVHKLIEQLADPDYATREAASKRLNDLGAPALVALRTAAESGPPERAERAAALVVRITRRIENEQALAPTVIELPVTTQTVWQLFDAIEKQSRVQLRIDGDQAILTQKVTPTGGKKPLWEHIQDVATKAGLEVAGANADRLGSPRLPEANEAMTTALRKEMKQSRESAATLKSQAVHLAQKLAQATDKSEKEQVAEQLQLVNRRHEELTAQIDQIEKMLGTRTPVLGSVLLRAQSGMKPTPACLSGAVRVEVTPASADLLKRYTPGHLPLAVKVFAEPKLEWYRVTETVVFEAVGPDGQPVAAESFTPKSFNTLANDELQFRRARLGLRDGEVAFAPATVGLAALAAPVSGKPLTLKSVRGVVRGTVWTEPGEVLAVGVGEKDGGAGATAGVNLRAKVIPPGEAKLPAPLVEVTLQIDPTTVRPLNTSAAGEGYWLQAGPGGRAVHVQAAPQSARSAADRHGLVFADAVGKPLEVTQHATTAYQTSQDGRYLTVMSLKYAVRNTPGNDGRAVATVSFHGTQQKAVEVPFRFTDVTLAPGTGDGQPLPEDYDIRLKR